MTTTDEKIQTATPAGLSTVTRSLDWRRDLVAAVLTADQAGDLPLDLRIDAQGAADTSAPCLRIRAECVEAAAATGAPESTPLQRMARLTGLVRALDALMAPADPQKLRAATAARGGSLPWAAPPAPTLDALYAATAAAALAVASGPLDTASAEMAARLTQALAEGATDPTALVAVHAAAMVLRNQLDAALDQLAQAAPPAAPAPNNAAEQAKVGA